MARRVISDTLHVTLVDSGDSIQITGKDREHVELVLAQLVQLGSTVVEKPREHGPEWTAACRRLHIQGEMVHIEQLGHRLLIRGRSIERVRAKVAELVESGSRPDGEIFRIDGFYTAICYAPPAEAKAS